MRVAHVMAGAKLGGAERFFERLCLAMHKAGVSVLPVIRRDPDRAARLRAGGLAPIELRFGGPFDLLTGRRLAQALHAWSPDVVIAWMNRAAMHLPSGPWLNVGRLGGYYDLRYYKACDVLVGNTRGIVNWLRTEGIDAEKSVYLPNFVEDFSSLGAVPASGTGPALLALGRLHHDKGFDIAIRALRRLPLARLTIAGEGPERRALTALIAAQGLADRAMLSGWSGQPGEMLRSADVFVCSSRVEPLGNIVLEAWSAGRPVVAMRAHGPVELVRHGSDGILVDIDDVAGLADALRSVMSDSDLATRLAGAGRLRYEAEFCESVVLERWLSALDALIRRHAARP